MPGWKTIIGAKDKTEQVEDVRQRLITPSHEPGSETYHPPPEEHPHVEEAPAY